MISVRWEIILNDVPRKVDFPNDQNTGRKKHLKVNIKVFRLGNEEPFKKHLICQVLFWAQQKLR